MPFVSFLGEDDTLEHIMRREPARYRPFVAFAQQVLAGPSALSAGERELLGAFVSALNGCAYCTGTHSAAAKAHGVDGKLVEALIADPAAMAAPARLRPLLAYARKLTQAPARLVQADADAVFAAGWDEQALSDVVAITALFAMANRLVDGHGVKGLPPAMNDMVGAYIAERGYVLP
ncbi:MAG: peroxidase [Alphaproteobacteria bacterium]|nr:MAG: peroxidase [Alphaproteobacteria bacterium]